MLSDVLGFLFWVIYLCKADYARLQCYNVRAGRVRPLQKPLHTSQGRGENFVRKSEDKNNLKKLKFEKRDDLIFKILLLFSAVFC